ncbi:MAG TPA: hypothetical protein PKD16_01275 [Saprospiraceae bacterium]|jgi:hypothetical protein|nr:hypothetical protein [Saprospiraceae bacterium]
MIPLNELRIGSIIKYLRADLIVKIKIVDNKLLSILTNQENQIDRSCHYPIGLTKEWFKKLGFIEYENEYDTTYEIEIEDGYKLESVKSLHSYTSFLLREVNNVTGDQLFFLPHNIEYVHQLQNLYFSLTGKELILS